MNTTSLTNDKKAILIYRIGQLGDTLISLPAISSIKDRYNDHRIILLTDRHSGRSGYVSSWDVLRPLDLFNEVLYYKPARGFLDSIYTMLNLYTCLKNKGIKKVYNLSPERRPGQKRRDRGFFKYLLGVKEYHEDTNTIWWPRNDLGRTPWVEPEWKRLLQVVGGDVRNTKYRLHVPSNNQDESRRTLEDVGVKGVVKLIALGPGSKMPSKRWPMKNYAILGDQILHKYPDISIAVFGGTEDSDVGSALCKKWGNRAFNLAGKLSIYGAAATIERCLFYVGNDTGTMHLAAMVGKPCIAIFSSRDYKGKWEPYGENHIIFRTDPECSGCMLEVCDRNMECLNSIVPTDVMSKVDSMMKALDS